MQMCKQVDSHWDHIWKGFWKIHLYWIKLLFELFSFPQFSDLDTLNSHLSQPNTSSLDCDFRLQKAKGSQSTEYVSFPATNGEVLAHISFLSPVEKSSSSALPFFQLEEFFLSQNHTVNSNLTMAVSWHKFKKILKC